MSGFVNYGKRSVTLPGGSKDLIDLLRPPQAAAVVSSAATERPIVTRGQHVTAGLAQIEGFLTKLLACRSELSSLMISSPGEEITLAFYRRASRRLEVLILISTDAALERAVRKFFGRQNLDPTRTYPIPKGEGRGLGWGLVYPLPSLLQEVSQVTGDLFRAIDCAEADLHFRFYQVAPPIREKAPPA